MFVLIQTGTNRILEVADAPFPVHPNFEWVERNDIGRDKISWKLENGVPKAPPEKVVQPVDEIKALKDRIAILENKKV